MENKLQPNQSTLSIKLIAQVNGPFVAHFGFEKVELDTSRLRKAILNGIKSVSIGRTDTADGSDGSDDALVIEASCECEVNKNGKSYRDHVANNLYGGPLGSSKINALEDTIRSLTADLIRYLAWRKGVTLHYDEIDKIAVSWQWEMDSESGDNTTCGPQYELLSLYEGTRLRYSKTLYITPADFEEFYALQDGPEPRAIPLHQELMMEVDRLIKVNKFQLDSNSRSAYLILYVAFEVATKSLIRYWNKDATWLVDNLPSPDLCKMYDKFINLNIAKILDKEELEHLKGIVFKRNKVAHTGEAVKAETLQKHFELVRKWITAIDYECGYKWAKIEQ